MSAPISDPSAGPVLTVRPDALTGLAAELTGLAVELSDEVVRCRGAGPSFAVALPGDEGWTAARVATVWGSVLEVVAARAGVLAGTLEGAAAAYRAAEVLRADRMPAHLGDR